MEGPLIDAMTRRDVTRESQEKLSAVTFDQLPLDLAIKQVKGDGSRKVAIFEDRTAVQAAAQDHGIGGQRDHLHVPVPDPVARFKIKVRDVWCAKDQGKTWDDWMLRGQPAAANATCPRPAAGAGPAPDGAWHADAVFRRRFPHQRRAAAGPAERTPELIRPPARPGLARASPPGDELENRNPRRLSRRGAALCGLDLAGRDSEVRIFNSHISDAQVEAELADFDVIVAMRERTPFPAARIQAAQAAVADHHRHAQQRHRHGGARRAASRLRRAGRRAGGHRHGRAGLGAHPGPVQAPARRGRGHAPGHVQTAMSRGRRRRAWSAWAPPWPGSAGLRHGRGGLEPNLNDERAREAGVTRVDKHELFATSDVVSLHLVLSDRTRNVVDARAGRHEAHGLPGQHLARRPGGPGPLMDALVKFRLAGAGLDVYHDEPLSPTDPVRDLDNVIPDAAPGLRQPREFRGLLSQRAGSGAGLAGGRAGARAERLTWGRRAPLRGAGKGCMRSPVSVRRRISCGKRRSSVRQWRRVRGLRRIAARRRPRPPDPPRRTRYRHWHRARPWA